MKRIISFAVILILVINMAACSTGDSSGAKAGTKAPVSYGTAGGTASGKDDKPSLTIYYMMYTNFVSNAIMEFKSAFKDVNVIQKFYYMESQDNPSNDDFMKAISTEILAGGGPDVFVCMPYSDIDSISKLCGSGAFADLNELISKDKGFKLEDYNKNILDAGVFNGKRMYVPLYFMTQYFYTTERALKQNNINLADDCSIKDLERVVDEFNKNKSRKAKYLFNWSISFYRLLNMYGVDFVDFQSKKSNFNSSEFKDLLRLYKKMQPLVASEEIQKKYGGMSTWFLKNDVSAFIFDGAGMSASLHSNNCLFKKEMNEDLKIVKISGSETAENLKPIITDIAAINNNCKNKEYAFEFIKILLSEKIQRFMYNDSASNTSFNPVNYNAFKKDIDRFTIYNKDNETVGERSLDSKISIMANSIPIPDSLVKRITDINNNMDRPIFMERSIKVIIDEALKDYLSGKKNENQTAQLINDKVELFLNE